MLIPQGRLPLLRLSAPQSFLLLQRTGARSGPLVVPVLRGSPKLGMFSAREEKGGIRETERTGTLLPPKRQGNEDTWTRGPG